MLFTTAPLPITELPADARHHGGLRRHPIQFIVLHTTEGHDSRRYLSTDPSSQVSCHRLIRTNERIYKILPDNYVAYCQGPARVGRFGMFRQPNMNEVSLSIELEHHHLTRKGYPTDLLEKQPYKLPSGGAYMVSSLWCTTRRYKATNTTPRSSPDRSSTSFASTTFTSYLNKKDRPEGRLPSILLPIRTVDLYPFCAVGLYCELRRSGVGNRWPSSTSKIFRANISKPASKSCKSTATYT